HSYPTRELLFQAAVNQVATDSASNTRTAVSSSGPLRDVKRAERIVARTLRIRLRGGNMPLLLPRREMQRRTQRLQGRVLCRWGQLASREIGGRGCSGQREGGRNNNAGGIAVGWVVVLVLLASALAARSHLVLDLAYARGAVPDAVAHGDAVGPEPVGALDEGGDGVRVGDAGGRGKCTYLPGHRQDLR
ncbi:hypothetical protein B0H14DRAFT_2743116, partial [Mycena olivaceomarginata]